MSLFKTPLRYPGGKQRLWKFIDEIITTNDLENGEYAEPYAGGAGVAIELLVRKRISKIHLNDSCIGVYAFWHSILNDTDRFCRRISRASLTVEDWRKHREVFKNRHDADVLDLGFAMFYLNRCNRSGILTGGVIGGLSQTGKWKMDARFPRNDLITRIEVIASCRSKIKITNWDAERFLTDYIPKLPPKSLVYCDPPYFRKAERLYPNHYKASDHVRIAQIVQTKVPRPWIVSYDSCEEIAALYHGRNTFEYSLQYSAAKAYKGAELFIFSDETRIPSESCVPSIQAALTPVSG